MLCGAFHTPPRWCSGWLADGPCPHTCSGEGNSESHLAEWAKQAENTFPVYFQIKGDESLM